MGLGVGWCPVNGQGKPPRFDGCGSICKSLAQDQEAGISTMQVRTLVADPLCRQPFPACPIGWQQEQAPDPTPRHRYTTALGKELAQLSPFDKKAGERMGGVVLVGDVDAGRREEVRRLWERLLNSEYFPKPDQQVEWRAVLWSQVNWELPRPHSKDPTPPRANVCFARWSSHGTSVMAVGFEGEDGLRDRLRVTITLKGDNEIHYRCPTLEDAENQKLDGRRNSWRVPVKDIDKQRLLNVLTTVFRFPWQTKADFLVTWAPSPVGKGDLLIESSRIPASDVEQQWFDEAGLDLADTGDGQALSISVSRLSRAAGG